MLLKQAFHLHYLDMVEHDLDFDNDDEEGFVASFKEDGTSISNMDVDLEDGNSVHPS
jgi:hypothetical protein